MGSDESSARCHRSMVGRAEWTLVGEEEQQPLGAKELPRAVLPVSGFCLVLTIALASSKHALLKTRDLGKSSDDFFLYYYSSY